MAFAHKLKAATEKLGDKVTSAVNKSRRAKDADFTETQKSFEEQQSNLKHLGQDIIAFIAAVDAIITSQKSMAENLLKVVPPNSAVASACNLVLKNAEDMLATKKTLLDTSMNNGFIIPLNTYQGQYREMGDRIKERHRREDEMYKCMEQRDKYQKNNDARFTASEQRVTASTQAYEDLNHEIMEDVPRLIADSEQFFQPLIYQLILNQAQFWSAMTQHATQLAANVDPQQAYTPPINPVITGKQTSSMTKKYAQQNNPWGNDINRPALTGPTANPWGAPAIEAGPGQHDPGHAPSPSPYGAPGGHAPAPFGAPGGHPPGGHAPGGHAAAPLPPRPVRNVPATPPAVQARGMWDFNASDASELPFKAGDVLNILEQNGEWWIAEMHGKRGQIPANYVQLI